MTVAITRPIQIGTERFDEVVPPGVLGTRLYRIVAAVVHPPAGWQTHVEIGLSCAGRCRLVRVGQDVCVHAVLICHLLQSVELVDAIGQSITVHFAQERRYARQLDRQYGQVDRQFASIRNPQVARALSWWRIEWHVDIDEYSLVSVRCQANPVGQGEQRIRDMASVVRYIQCLKQVGSPRPTVETKGDANSFLPAQQRLKANHFSRRCGELDALAVKQRILRAIVSRQVSHRQTAPVVLVSDRYDCQTAYRGLLCRRPFDLGMRGFLEGKKVTTDSGWLRTLPTPADCHHCDLMGSSSTSTTRYGFSLDCSREKIVGFRL